MIGTFTLYFLAKYGFALVVTTLKFIFVVSRLCFEVCSSLYSIGMHRWRRWRTMRTLNNYIKWLDGRARQFEQISTR